MLVLRPAHLGDVEAIVELVESAYRGDASRAGWTTEADLLDGQRTDAAAVGALVERHDGCVLLAFSGARLLASCELARHDDGSAYFGMFAVRPGHQGGGLGGRVLAAAERFARGNWKSSRMSMTVLAQRPELIAWYERRGYRRTGAVKPFPYGDERLGIPRRDDLEFAVLEKWMDLDPDERATADA
jgi:GNAT superfamily N-acetyltransferase